MFNKESLIRLLSSLFLMHWNWGIYWLIYSLMPKLGFIGLLKAVSSFLYFFSRHYNSNYPNKTKIYLCKNMFHTKSLHCYLVTFKKHCLWLRAGLRWSSPIGERVKSQKVPSEIIRSPQVWFQMRGQGQFGDPGLDGRWAGCAGKLPLWYWDSGRAVGRQRFRVSIHFFVKAKKPQHNRL